MLTPASETGKLILNSRKIIRFVWKGCTNRPFFHIVLIEKRQDQFGPVIEQLGSYDPIPNEHNEKLVSLNYERIRYWLGNGAIASKPVEQLFGLGGFFPIHPTSYMIAWRNRASENASKQKVETSQEEKLDKED